MEKGITLLALHDQTYGWWAYNMAISIKYLNPKLTIQLVTDKLVLDGLTKWHLKKFDIITKITDKHKQTKDQYNGRQLQFDPAFAKMNLYKYIAFDHTIYLDVDGLCVRDLEFLFQECIGMEGGYYTDLINKGRLGGTFKDMAWATPDIIWEKFKLDKDAVMPFTNSSFQYIKKCTETEILFDTILDCYNSRFELKDLKHTWGKGQPDELYLNIALTKCNIMPVLPLTKKVVALRNKAVKGMDDITKESFILGLYGIKNIHTHTTMVDLAEVYLRKIYKDMLDMDNSFKVKYLMNFKYLKKNRDNR